MQSSTGYIAKRSRGFGRKMVLDVALTRIDCQSTTSDDLSDRALQACHEQKMTKYSRVADENGLQCTPTIFSRTGQIHGAFNGSLKNKYIKI